MNKYKHRVVTFPAGKITMTLFLITVFLVFRGNLRFFQFLHPEGFGLLFPFIAVLLLIAAVSCIIVANTCEKMRNQKNSQAITDSRTPARKDPTEPEIDDNLIVKVSTKMDYWVIYDFSLFSRTKSKTYRLVPIVLMTTSIMGAVYGISKFIRSGVGIHLVLPAVVAFVGIFAVNEAIAKNNKIKSEKGQLDYWFYKNLVDIRFNSIDSNSEIKVQYNEFISVYESSRAFYLYRKSNDGFVISKKFLDDVQITKVSKLLKGIFQDKYKDFV